VQKWHETRTSWRDAKSTEFERVFLGDLMGTVEQTVTTIEQVDKLINKIKRDCE
jgi:hypothetical protein